MRRTRGITLLSAMVLFASSLCISIASNRGFVLNKHYSVTNGTYTISLPYLQSNYPTAASLFNDIPAASQVCRLNSNESMDCWLGNFTGSPNFGITPGEGYIIVPRSSTSHVVMGSHDPQLILALQPTGTHLCSLPYNSSYARARDLFNDVPHAVGVCRINLNNSRDCWLGDFTGSPNWNLTRGDAVIISVNAATSWTPRTSP